MFSLPPGCRLRIMREEEARPATPALALRGLPAVAERVGYLASHRELKPQRLPDRFTDFFLQGDLGDLVIIHQADYGQARVSRMEERPVAVGRAPIIFVLRVSRQPRHQGQGPVFGGIFLL